jgi:hypothetical protein
MRLRRLTKYRNNLHFTYFIAENLKYNSHYILLPFQMLNAQILHSSALHDNCNPFYSSALKLMKKQYSAACDVNKTLMFDRNNTLWDQRLLDEVAQSRAHGLSGEEDQGPIIGITHSEVQGLLGEIVQGPRIVGTRRPRAQGLAGGKTQLGLLYFAVPRGP